MLSDEQLDRFVALERGLTHEEKVELVRELRAARKVVACALSYMKQPEVLNPDKSNKWERLWSAMFDYQEVIGAMKVWTDDQAVKGEPT